MSEHVDIRINLPDLISGTAALIDLRARGGVRTRVDRVAHTVFIIVKLARGASRRIHCVDVAERCAQTRVHVIAYAIIVVIEDANPAVRTVPRDITICAVAACAITIRIPIA